VHNHDLRNGNEHERQRDMMNHGHQWLDRGPILGLPSCSHPATGRIDATVFFGTLIDSATLERTKDACFCYLR